MTDETTQGWQRGIPYAIGIGVIALSLWAGNKYFTGPSPSSKPKQGVSISLKAPPNYDFVDSSGNDDPDLQKTVTNILGFKKMVCPVYSEKELRKDLIKIDAGDGSLDSKITQEGFWSWGKDDSVVKEHFPLIIKTGSNK